jgi:hypothetical protein
MSLLLVLVLCATAAWRPGGRKKLRGAIVTLTPLQVARHAACP